MSKNNRVLFRVVSFSISLSFCLSAANTAHGELVGYWPMDEGQGNEVEDKGNAGNDGTIAGTPKWVDGVLGKALEFDGLSWVDCGSDESLKLPGPMTCTFWMKPTKDLKAGMPKMNLVHFAHTGPMFRVLDNGKIRTWSFAMEGENFIYYIVESKQTSWPAGSWYHLACTYDGANLILYVNGNEVGRTDMKIVIGDRIGTFTIGWTASGLIIDEVKYYDEALTAEQVQEEYLAPVVPQDKLASTWGSIRAGQYKEVQRCSETTVFFNASFHCSLHFSSASTSPAPPRKGWPPTGQWTRAKITSSKTPAEMAMMEQPTEGSSGLKASRDKLLRLMARQDGWIVEMTKA